MAETPQLADLMQLIDAKAKKRRRLAAIYLALVAILGVFLTVWSGIAGVQLREKAGELREKERQLKEKNEQLEKQEGYLKKANANIDASNDVYLGMGAARNGHWGEAIKYYQKALDIDPNNDYAMAYMGYALYRLALRQKSSSRSNQLKEAINILERDIAVNTDSIYGHYNLALAYLESGRKGEADAELRKLVEMHPGVIDDPQFKQFKSNPKF